MESVRDTLMVEYLLGELSEEEVAKFEERYFSDDQVFEDLQSIETELIDSYVKDELSDSERERFETYYLNSPQRRDKVETAKCLIDSITEVAAEKSFMAQPKSFWKGIIGAFSSLSPPMRLGYAMAVVAILAFLAITLLQNQSLRSELGRLRTERLGLIKRDQDLEQQIAKVNGAAAGQTPSESRQETAQAQASQPLVASITLTPGLFRGAGSEANKRLIVQSSARWVVVNLSLDRDEYPTGYRAVVETADGNEVERVDRLKCRTRAGLGKVIAVEMPTELLGSDNYIVKLLGITAQGSHEEVEDYSFQVVRR